MSVHHRHGSSENSKKTKKFSFCVTVFKTLANGSKMKITQWFFVFFFEFAASKYYYFINIIKIFIVNSGNKL